MDENDPVIVERSLQALLDNSPDRIFFKDRQSRFTKINQAAAAFLGIADPAVAIGKTDADFFLAPLAREFLADERRLFSTGKPLIDKSESHVDADGQTHWVLTTKAPVRDPDGHITGLVGIAREIFDREKADHKLRESELRHRELLAEARRQTQELTLLGEVRSALARELELSDLFRTVVEAIARTFGYKLVSLYILKDDVLVLQHQVGYECELQHIPVTKGINGRVIRTGEAILIDDVQADPDFLAAAQGIVSEICVPLHDGDRVVGTLNVESQDTVRVTEADLRLMVALSEHVNVAIGRARLYTDVRRSEARFRALVQNASDIITILDADGTIRYESPAVERIFGYQPAELVGRNAFDFVHPEDLQQTFAAFLAGLNEPTLAPSVTVALRCLRKDGTWRWLEATGMNLLTDPAVGGIVINSRDITERRESADRLWHQAHHDPLTGLPNRTLFLERLTQALDEQRSEPIAVLFLDLDGFKVVNDSLGHEYGDRLLTEVSNRLASRLRAGDLLARFGGDEFMIFPDRSTDAARVIGMAERLLGALTAPFTVNGQTLSCSASMGVVLSSSDLTTSADLLRAVDVALYRAKASGNGSVALFDATRDAPALMRLDRETALRHALELEELRLHYQPKVDLATGRLVGVEALVRWQHPNDGLLGPDAFIPLAEETGLIVPLGVWVLRAACRQMLAWDEQFPDADALDLCVNISPVQVRHPGLVVQVDRVLRETGFPPGRLMLEITERGLVENTEVTDRAVKALRARAVRLAIDDFGTYQAGLGYLSRWPMDAVKLDRSLVIDLDHNPRSLEIVTAVVGLAKRLSMIVTGEGIETAAQLSSLRELGCDFGQGFYFAPPLPPERFTGLLERGAISVP